ncbi:MAG: hypothetical protein KGP10_03415 [Actinomycetales bacterium]|nr:hypothetical protein [Actinomycetales bacterium]
MSGSTRAGVRVARGWPGGRGVGGLLQSVPWAVVVVAGLGLVGVGVGVWSVMVGGIGWDTRHDLLLFAEVRRIVPAQGLASAYDTVTRGGEFYGVLLLQAAELARDVATGRPVRSGPDDPGTYLWLSWVTFTTGVLAAAAVGWAVARAVRSPLAGATAAALLITTPLWLGMSVVNHKDLPVAAGLTLTSAAISVATQRLRPATLTLTALTACLGGILTLGTRPGAVALLIALTGATTGILAVAAWRLRTPRLLTWPAATSALAVVAGLIGVWWTNPLGRTNLGQWLTDAVRNSGAFPFDGLIRTAGIDVRSTELPWWYVPAWLLAQAPLLTTALLLTTLILITLTIAQRIRSRRTPSNTPTGPTDEPIGLLPLTPFLVQSTVLPTLIVASGAVLYDGIRHLLFIVPGLIAITGLGIALLEHREIGHRLPGPRLAAITAITVVAASCWATTRWAPYSYAYINPLAGATPNTARATDEPAWELDYWGATAREGLTRTKRACIDAASRCAPFVIIYPESDTAEPYGGLNEDDQLLAGRTEYAIYEFWRGGSWDTQVPADTCTERVTIRRDAQTLGRGYLCQTK